DAGDLDVHLECGDTGAGAGDLEVHVAEVVFGTLDVRQDHVVVALLDEAHGDAADRLLDRDAGVHQGERRAADRAHRRRAVRLERLGDDADRVGEVLRRRDDRLQRPLRERTVADVAALRPPHEPGLADRVGREVVVVHEPPLLLQGEVVDPLTLLGGAEREQRHVLRRAAGEEARAVRARRDSNLTLDRPDLVGGTTVRAPLVHRDLLPDEVLVDRLGSPLHPGTCERVLNDRALAIDRRRADRERQLDRLDDPVEEQLTLGRAQLLRILLGLGQLAERVLELVPDRLIDSGHALAIEDLVEALLVLDSFDDVVLARGHLDRRGLLREDLLHGRGSLAEPDLLDGLANAAGEALLEVGGDVGLEPFGLADLLAKLLLPLADRDDLGVRQLERLEEPLLWDLVAAGLDHRQAVLRADDDQVESVVLLALFERRVEDELVVDQRDANRAHRPDEGQRRDHQRRRGAVDAQDVVRDDHVRRQDGADHLHLVAEALRPQRPDRAVDHPRGQDRPLGWAPLTLEEAAGDLPRGVHALLDVDGEWEEIRALARLHPPLRCRQHHRVAQSDDPGAVGLLGQLAGLEAQLLTTDLHGDLGRACYCDAHRSSTSRGRWRFEPTPGEGARSNFPPPASGRTRTTA